VGGAPKLPRRAGGGGSATLRFEARQLSELLLWRIMADDARSRSSWEFCSALLTRLLDCTIKGRVAETGARYATRCACCFCLIFGALGLAP
jgi:hypothetical protein